MNEKETQKSHFHGEYILGKIIFNYFMHRNSVYFTLLENVFIYIYIYIYIYI